MVAEQNEKGTKSLSGKPKMLHSVSVEKLVVIERNEAAFAEHGMQMAEEQQRSKLTA